MTTKHTPGPWLAFDDFYDECVRVIDGNNNRIAVFRYGADQERHIIARATAHLIAAAPEMIAELREVNSLLAHLTSAHPDGGLNKMLCKRGDSINTIFKKVEAEED